MTLNRYTKAIVAGVLAGGTTFESASGATGHRLVLALVAAVVVGVTTWGVPNEVTTELTAVASAVEHTFDPGVAPVATAVRSQVSDVTSVLPKAGP